MGSATETAAAAEGSVPPAEPQTGPTPAPQPSPPGPRFDVVEEVRLAVVMYGGVSLSIYMNGVAQEMYSLVRSTAARNPGSESPLGDDELTPVQKVYRRLAKIDPEDLSRLPDADSDICRRFVIDVLSGTSAGGINAVFLAKALANGQDMAGLTDLWMEEGDVGRLMNDKRSLPEELPPESLLNSGHMYDRLLKAFTTMDEDGGETTSGLTDAVDLFVTTTDLYGFELPIRLANANTMERRYRNVFHFAYSAAEPALNPFVQANNPFLAFACRCTSAFPLAFKPMTLHDIDPLVKPWDQYRTRTSATDEWRKFYPDYAAPADPATSNSALQFADRPFADGGALDNKPFGWAVDTLRSRRAEVPVDRKLVFVEPDPTAAPAKPDPKARPDALRNALAQGVQLPRQETVRDDLNRVDDLNRMARRVEIALNQVIEHIDAPDYRDAPIAITRATPADLDPAREQQEDEPGTPPGYHGYLALRDESVLEDLADLIARLAPVPSGGEYRTAIRALLKAWRKARYGSNESEGGFGLQWFLWTFDQGHRLRRLGFMERRADSMFRGDASGTDLLAKFLGPNPPPVDTVELRRALTFVKQGITRATKVLADAEADLRRTRGATSEVPANNGPAPVSLSELIRGSGVDLQALADIYGSPTDAGRAEAARRIVEPNLEAMDRVLFTIATARAEAARLAYEAVAEGLNGALPTPEQAQERRRLGQPPPPTPVEGRIAAAVGAWAYQQFDAFDLVAFPLQYGSDAGEGDQVEVVRISPGDARALIPGPHAPDDAPAGGPGGSGSPPGHGSGAGKVTGARVFHFGAFLEEKWRRNDIMWGRLDAADILIGTLVPQLDGRDEVVNALRFDAFRAIMREELEQPEFAELFSKDADAGVELEGRLRERIEGALPPDGMTGVFRDTYERPGHLLRDEMLDDAGRGAGVGARVLGGIVHARGDAKAPLPFRLAARVGVLAAVVLAAAVPKSERHKRAKLVMFLAYLVGAGVIALGASQDWAVLTKVGIWLVVLTAAANIGLWLLARKLRLGALGSSSLWVTGALALAIAAGGVLVLAEFELLRAADGPVPWLVSAVALALVIGGALIRRKPKRHPPAPGQPPPPPPPDPTSEQAKRTKSRRRWALIAMLVGVVWLLLLAGWQLDHIGQTRDWVPLFSKHSAGA